MEKNNNILLLAVLAGFFAACNPVYHVASGDYSNEKMEAAIPLDTSFMFLYMPYTQSLNKEMDDVIGKSNFSMVKNKPESPLTNFLADLILEESALIMRSKNIRPDVSFLNYGGIRTGLPKGDVTVRNIYEIMPFENELVLLKLKGFVLREFLNFIATQGGDSLGGVRFKIENNRAVDISVGGELLKDEQFYWLVTSDYIADGGDKFAMLQNIADRIDTTQKIRDVMIDHLKRTYKEGKIIDPENDGRITHE